MRQEEVIMFQFSYKLKVAERVKAKCERHPRVVRPESFDPNLLCRLLDDRPDRPVAQLGANQFAAFGKRAQQTTVLDLGRDHPGVDSVLDPEWNCHGADSTALPTKIGQDPSALPHLDTVNVQTGQLLPAQGTAQQPCQYRVVPFAFDLGAVRDREELLGLFPREPVPTLVPFWERLGTPGRLAASSAPMIPLRCASLISLRTADKRTFTVEALNPFSSMAARYSIKRARDNGCLRSSHNAKTSSSALA
jgi:hypothetical protein